ncbi:MAG: helix-turn-helix domain-containing protein [Pseudomonadales bacterium]
MLNGVEFASFLLPQELYTNYVWMMQLYYLSGIVAVAAMLDVAMSVVMASKTEWRKANVVLVIAVGALTVMPGSVIAGVVPMGDFARRVSGPAMPIYFTYIVPALIASFALPFWGIKRAPSKHRQRQSCALMLGVAPLTVSTAIILVMMQFDWAVNGAVILSTMTTVLVIVLFISESRYGLFKLLSRVPATLEYKARRDLHSMVDQLHKTVSDPNKQSNLADYLRQMESLSIALAIEANDGNLSKTARQMGVSRTTILRKRPQKEATPG